MIGAIIGFVIGLLFYHVAFSLLFWLSARKNPFIVKMIDKVDSLVNQGAKGKVEIISSFKDDFEKSENIEDILL